MQILVLVAGYGTRLYPLTKDKPKPLLSCGGRAILDYLLDKVKGLGGLKNVIVVTNNKFHEIFEDWAGENKSFPVPIRVINDETTSPDDRLGAMGDIAFVLKKNRINQDLLILGGDNLFDSGLDSFFAFARKNSPQMSIGLYDIKDKSAAKQFGVVKLDGAGKVVSFEEKPALPQSSLIAMCLYYLPKESFHFIEEYIRDSRKTDTTGDFVRWLSQRNTVYGFRFEGKWYDIGSVESYREAQEIFQSHH